MRYEPSPELIEANATLVRAKRRAARKRLPAPRKRRGEIDGHVEPRDGAEVTRQGKDR
jgi:hypothetical protein